MQFPQDSLYCCTPSRLHQQKSNHNYYNYYKLTGTIVIYFFSKLIHYYFNDYHFFTFFIAKILRKFCRLIGIRQPIFFITKSFQFLFKVIIGWGNCIKFSNCENIPEKIKICELQPVSVKSTKGRRQKKYGIFDTFGGFKSHFP